MRIKEFSISRYGPLKETGKVKPGDYCLFYGLNEKGKTLTIDALLKFLLGKKAVFLNSTGRVNEMPEGYLVVEQNDNDENILPAEGTLTDINGLTAAELCNIFVVRDSAHAIKDESGFYHNLTNRLTGLRTGDIRAIKRELSEIGQITPTGEYLNKAPHKLKDRLNKAVRLVDKIDNLLLELNKEDFNLYEERAASLVLQNKKLEKELAVYNKAEKRELYEKVSDAFLKLEKAFAERCQYDLYSEQQLTIWQRAESNLDLISSELISLEKELQDGKREVQSYKNLLEKEKHILVELEEKRKLLTEKLKPLTEEYELMKAQEIKKEALTGKMKSTGSYFLFTSVFMISLIGSILKPEWWLFTILVLSFTALVISFWQRWSWHSTNKELDVLKKKIIFEAELVGIKDRKDKVEDIIGEIDKSARRVLNQQETIKDLESKITWSERQQDKLIDTLDKKKKAIAEIDESLDKIKSESGVESIEQYIDALNYRKQLEDNISKQKNTLENHFGLLDGEASSDNSYHYWKERIEELKKYANSAPGIKYNQVTVKAKEKELEDINEEKIAIEDKLEERNHDLRDLEKEVNELLLPEYNASLPVQTTLDLEEVRTKIEEWINQQEDNKSISIAAISIFEEIEKEEEEKIITLFEPGNRAGDYLREISGGKYTDVSFDGEDKSVKVVCSDGNLLDALQLSGGAYDQLYFSIRLALAEKLLEGEKGFFILDDPFIKSDLNRLKIQLRILEIINKSGWQILYFSAKKEIQDALQEKIDSGTIGEYIVS